jgi:heme oxygenase
MSEENAPARGVVLAYLRQETRQAHLAIEGSLGLMGERITLRNYTDVLSRLYGFWREWEPRVASLIQDDEFLAPRRRKHLLAADLVALGMTEHMIEALPQCPLTGLHDEMHALGSLYVMEGSSLGGRTIQHNVERCLGVGVLTSSSYFRGYGPQTGAMWHSFLARLEQAPVTRKYDIRAGALATFSNLDMWLRVA